MTGIQKRLFALQDIKYREFNSALIPTVEKERIIGVRTPEIRKLAKELYKAGLADDFLRELPHRYFEEDSLHAALIAHIKEPDVCLEAIDRFLPFTDNWAVCDMLRPKAPARDKDGLMVYVRRWMESERLYTVRFAIGMLMTHFIKEDFREEYAELVAGADTKEYYLSMMVAWYFATLLVYHFDTAVAFLTEDRLDAATHNRTIQKAVDSYRITEEQKLFLKGLRRREKN